MILKNSKMALMGGMLMFGAVGSASALTASVSLGDVNGDGAVNVADATRILRSAVDLETPEGGTGVYGGFRFRVLGDVNTDQKIDITDVIQTLQASVGTRTLPTVDPLTPTLTALPTANVDAILALNTHTADLLAALRDTSQSEETRAATARTIFAREGGLLEAARLAETDTGYENIAGYILSALNDTAEPFAARLQRVDKGLNRITSTAALHRLGQAVTRLQAGDTSGAQRAVDEAWGYWQTFKILATRRESGFPKFKDQLIPPIEAAFLGLANAVAQNKPLQAQLDADFLRKKVAQLFYLGTINYIRSLANDVATGTFEKTHEHRAEGYSFFLSLEPALQYHQGLVTTLRDRLNQPITEQNPLTIEERNSLLTQLNNALLPYLEASNLILPSEL